MSGVEALKSPIMEEDGDLDEVVETPEQLLLQVADGINQHLSPVPTPPSFSQQQKRVILMPWLKFMWETYRNVLDLLKNNSKLESLYQSTALKAFDFCFLYKRRQELRRLCELLRNHLTNTSKYANQSNAIDFSTGDSLQLHLDTRFKQLSITLQLELWQEAFRSVEDIHGLLAMGKKVPKLSMMLNYYDALIKIFRVSNDYVLHAASWNRYMQIAMQHVNIPDHEIQR